MKIAMKEIRRCLTNGDCKELFVEYLGWNAARETLFVQDGNMKVEAVANLKGFVVLVCTPINGQFPGSAERKQIEREISKLHHEHILIFVGDDRQVWQVPKREAGKTTGTSEITHYKGKGIEHLARRVAPLKYDTFEQAEEETLIGVAERVTKALVADKVTKKFYKEFSDRRKALLKFLDWIEDESKRDWYCSVLLNRLMFIYFIAEKGFLPGGRRFLSEQLAANAETNGVDTFYTRFLLPLSFFGFGERQGERHDFEEQFKDVLYLNGGLFTVHTLEAELGISKEAVRTNSLPPQAKIPDAEFLRWFEYFDDWRWTLDEEKVENDGQISPHILGYIFEKYINQKQMGAYYTKEDITGYICRNTIIPRLFDMLAETGDQGKKAVDPLPIGPHPNLLNDGRGISDGEGIDRYVYPSVKQEEKLPTETDYEQSQRRQRYERTLNDFDEGKVSKIDDFITYNLDIEKLALDFVSNIQDPVVMHRLYFRCLRKITVLDPTCGSGAFLFAALGILYPLYNAALSRMQFLVGKATGKQPDVVNWDGRLHFDDLEVDQSTFADAVGADEKIITELSAEVERINDHPSAEYFIKKTVIVNNLFGVDIMEEAVEICKLRLFLSLISTVERDDRKPNLGVEPLPDIDFNIIAGNTLVGYSRIADIDRLWHEAEFKEVKTKDGSSQQQAGMAFEKDHSKLKQLVSEYSKLLGSWRLQQLGEWSGAPISKEQLTFAAGEVRRELDPDLWRLYKTAGLVKDKVTLAEFKRTHEPLHWLLEFPQVEALGGFDALVGNPPYIESTKIKDYVSIGLQLRSCGNLYAYVLERSNLLLKRKAFLGMIVPMSSLATERMRPLAKLLIETSSAIWTSHFGVRPSKLFEGVNWRLSVVITKQGESPQVDLWTTKHMRWMNGERQTLFTGLSYTMTDYLDGFPSLPKHECQLSEDIALKVWKHIPLAQHQVISKTRTRSFIHYQEATQYWVKAITELPFYERNGHQMPPAHGRFLYLREERHAQPLCALLNSSLFYILFNMLSDCYHLGDSLVRALPVPYALLEDNTLSRLMDHLVEKLKSDASINSIQTKNDDIIRYAEFSYTSSKPSIDEIDRVLAEHYGFTEQELEFILNYDLKYRMGSSGQEEY